MSPFARSNYCNEKEGSSEGCRVETVDRTGTFLGSLRESKTNMAVTLLEAGLEYDSDIFWSRKDPRLSTPFYHASSFLEIISTLYSYRYVEGQVHNGSNTENKQNKVLKVVVTEVLGIIGAFNPAKGGIVLSQFSLDNSWNRAMIVDGPQGAIHSPNDKFEIVYIDYGNQETVPYCRLRSLDSVSSEPGLAQLCKLAYIKLPDIEDDFGYEAMAYLSGAL
uniref:Tudor domain-containing protein n=1 Tax=Ananas comosus var. bracteatus TaxID=296719 RepID=A0A6V7QV73_ANACO